MTGRWCRSPYAYERRRTREVRVGDVGVGGDNPIRVQSMTTPATTDVPATLAQIVRLVEAGCEIVRVTVPTSADARALPEIRRGLMARKVRVPLVADIHFSPGAALKAVEHVEKIRVNPGNYADRKQFAVREYTDSEYDSELARLADTFRPLVRRTKELGVAMRIGTNHGSLSDRIVNRYGDSPLGMVESALEFVRICEAEGYRELIVSMKASNPVVTIQAYRLLAARMDEAGMDYPFHLGVTEAGDGEDGRIKSAIGIGSLLDDGIGDTVRVSLTEDPVAEVPVAQRLVLPYNRRAAERAAAPRDAREEPPLPFDPFSHARRRAEVVRFGPYAAGGEETVRVEVPLVSTLAEGDTIRREIDAQSGPRVPLETRAEMVETGVADEEDLARARTLRAALTLVAPNVALCLRLAPPVAARALAEAAAPSGRRGLADVADRVVLAARSLLEAPHAVRPSPHDLPATLGAGVLLEGRADEILAVFDASPEGSARIADAPARPAAGLMVTIPVGAEPAAGAGAPSRTSPVHEYRLLAAGLAARGLAVPILLSFDARRAGAAGDDALLAPSLVLGSLLCDGIGDAVRVRAADAASSRALAFNILQGARVRTSKTEFISCPSCGRTLFDLEETTRRIKERTAHLKGLKIAIMGCVVNGPGEMADADFGYVGWGADKIALFVGKDLVARDIPTAEADERLIALIKEHGRWQEPALTEEPAS